MPDRQGSPIIVTGKRQPQVTAIMRWSSRRNAKHERSKKRARPGKLIEAGFENGARGAFRMRVPRFIRLALTYRAQRLFR
jgi:hypothetical protein